ncbi:hypothetical protein VNO77_07391 [Canavalia gladiata]|uniref:Uncharacterized protein n=1 Tax=Canavalia gladiata TaxID=3824 RepID=A0AAN9M7K8_CANGL
MRSSLPYREHIWRTPCRVRLAKLPWKLHKRFGVRRYLPLLQLNLLGLYILYFILQICASSVYSIHVTLHPYYFVEECAPTLLLLLQFPLNHMLFHSLSNQHLRWQSIYYDIHEVHGKDLH